MKKICSVLLVLCMLATVIVPVAAVEEPTLAESLVTHYDFEGETLADALKDKATVGTADDLVMESRDAAVTPAETDFTWDKENGTLANLNNTVGLKTELSDDFKVNSANGTYFFRFQVNGGEGEEGLFDIRTSGKRALAIGYKVDGAKLNVYAGWSGGNKNTQTLSVYDAETKPFVNIAVSFAKVESNTVVKYYLAVEGEKDWTMVKEQTMEGGAWEVDATTVPRVFGTCFGAGAKVRFVADDIRIYNKTLSDAELYTVLSEFLPQIVISSSDENLVTHYDFKGDTFADALKDKATHGAAQDDLSMESRDEAVTPAETDFTWDKENGTLANLNNSVGLTAALSDDFKVNSTNGTYYFRFQANGGEGEEGLFDIRTSGKRALAIGYKVDGAKLNVYAGYSAGNKNTQTVAIYDAENKPFVNIAVTFEKGEGQTDTVVKYWFAYDGEAEWTLVKEQPMAGGAWEVDETTVPRVFGTCFGAGAKVRFVADDIRIYNKAMSAAELQTLLLDMQCNGTQKPVMEVGAAIGLRETSGDLLFTSHISATLIAAVNAAKDEDTAVVCGTIVAAKSDLAENAEFTAAALTAAGKSFIDKNGYGIAESDDAGNVIIRAALDIEKADWGKDFAARSYIKYIKNGQEVIIYADYTEASNCRTVKAVATAALADVVATADAEYAFALAEGGYSCYNEAERAAIQAYLAE